MEREANTAAAARDRSENGISKNIEYWVLGGDVGNGM